MSENRTNGLRRGARAAGVGAAAAVALGLLSTGAANADTFVPLPDGEKVGPGVTIKRTHEHALISPSMAANGAGRVVWVSGNASADVTVTPEGEVGPNNGPAGAPGTNNSSTHGASQLNTGYIVGCQVSIGNESHEKRNKFKGKSGSVTWADETIGLSGCAGYAQARAFVKVKVETENVMSVVTLWGQPFSIG
ncbi:MspA family porin [Nocardia cyriacigeorgica]|uniref:MspA family porin n=1 Tax=Nocardia cyriacigeorgica TaxID=135487 RepID=UPI0018932EEA|nr:MspA family porin [Nocardia cyriacigeorgica]MBF6497059.1 MspA family porin [Nocardia cyriacigeorgica]